MNLLLQELYTTFWESILNMYIKKLFIPFEILCLKKKKRQPHIFICTHHFTLKNLPNKIDFTCLFRAHFRTISKHKIVKPRKTILLLFRHLISHQHSAQTLPNQSGTASFHVHQPAPLLQHVFSVIYNNINQITNVFQISDTAEKVNQLLWLIIFHES